MITKTKLKCLTLSKECFQTLPNRQNLKITGKNLMFDLACLTHAHAYNKIHLCKKMNEIVHVPVHDSMIFKFFKSNMDAYVFKFSS